ncbi:MAG: replication factor C small subunit [Desulfurococcales archaeon]|nr:replication factor C small subunit [Desulfurococcales archaeon]
MLELNASVSKHTPVPVKLNNRIKLVTFEELDRIYFSNPARVLRNDHGEYVNLANHGLEVLTINKRTWRLEWRRVSWLIRHRVSKIIRVRIAGGQYIELTGNHSVMAFNKDGDLVERSAAELRPGDYLISIDGGPLGYDRPTTEKGVGRAQDRVVITSVGSRRGSVTAEITVGTLGYTRADSVEHGFLPVEPFIRFLEETGYTGAYGLVDESKPQLYGGLIPKSKAQEILATIDDDPLSVNEKEKIGMLKRLAYSDLHVVRIESIELVDYNDYVYDVSVPGNNMFFAGHTPVLLHNSDERGINVIREKVKEFARSRTPPEIPFKIVLLDEADNMTADAQQALRRLMELYSANTRFILIANYPSKIIDPIQSRCAFFRFQPLKKDDVVNRLRYIAEKEGVDYEEEALETIYEISEGDMRKAINVLQAAAAIGRVTVEVVFKVVGLAKPKEVREMLELALKGDFVAARNLMRKLMIEYGLSGEDLIKQIHREIMGTELNIPEEARVLIADYVGEIHFRLVEGSDDDIQLSAFLAWLSLLGPRLGVES